MSPSLSPKVLEFAKGFEEKKFKKFENPP